MEGRLINGLLFLYLHLLPLSNLPTYGGSSMRSLPLPLHPKRVALPRVKPLPLPLPQEGGAYLLPLLTLGEGVGGMRPEVVTGEEGLGDEVFDYICTSFVSLNYVI